ncbi:helix-turn-helix transcriptional regulator [Tomitella fengzijianii]|uniref:DNA-binding protein n=1 Tax=Tomitella fengzijianii TaxID=2597660 RepID=A0A516X523_9ACTN|nr:DNA-binding protein [Tomitella fengzijianii]QDQ98113.1 DNA-binding protein [Tomitella fengzijianii]
MATPKRLPLATPEEVADFRRVTVSTLAQERYRGNGPKFMKLGRRVFYDWQDVYDWLDSNLMTRTDARAAT